MAPFISALSVALFVALMVGVLSQAVRVFRFAGGSSLAWAALALAPAEAALFTLLALLTPNPFSASCHCDGHATDHPHLCWVHPGFAEQLLVPAFACLGLWLAL